MYPGRPYLYGDDPLRVLRLGPSLGPDLVSLFDQRFGEESHVAGGIIGPECHEDATGRARHEERFGALEGHIGLALDNHRGGDVLVVAHPEPQVVAQPANERMDGEEDGRCLHEKNVFFSCSYLYDIFNILFFFRKEGERRKFFLLFFLCFFLAIEAYACCTVGSVATTSPQCSAPRRQGVTHLAHSSPARRTSAAPLLVTKKPL